MKKITKLLALVGMSLTASLQGQVFFSEYAEGTSNNKYLEIYNGSGSDVNLEDYLLVNCSNGCKNDGIKGAWQMTFLGVGPAKGNTSWYSTVVDESTRSCLHDDYVIFHKDGVFQNAMGDETFLEGWQHSGTGDICGAPAAPFDGKNLGTWKDNGDGTVTVYGQGSHIGIPKVHNGGETSDGTAKDSITYEYTITNDSSMVIEIEINGGAYWTFHYVKAMNTFEYDNSSLFSGKTLKSGEVFVIAHGSAQADIKAEGDVTHNFLSNGNDWYALWKKSDRTFVDEIGENTDEDNEPSEGWDVAGTTAATKDHTLTRKSYAKGNMWSKSAGTNETNSEWVVSDKPTADYVSDGLGSHERTLRSMDEDAAEFMDVLKVKTLGKFQVPGNVFDESAAEIPAYDKERNQIFFTDANSDVVHVLDMKDPNKLTLKSTIQLGGSPNSVAVYGDIVAVAVEADPKQDPGKVEFYAADDFKKLGEVTVGALPDMVTFNGDGTKVLTANEGEPSGDYKNDPEGSVSIITVNTSDLSKSSVVTVDFKEYNGKVPSGVRVFGRSAMGEGDAADDTKTTLAQDLEPEYITVNGDKAYVACQENNALAIIDITTAKVLNLLPLGTKDHSLPGNGLDASNKDDGIYISQWPIKGMYMPDAIASFESDGKTYLVTANEGDAREYLYEKDGEEILSFTDETRVKDLNLDPTAFPYADLLQQSDQLGRIKTSLVDGDTDGDGDYDEIYTYGSRSFTIWDASNGAVVWDSKNDFEQLLKQRVPDNFNATNDENNFDNRSDDKGPEPEGVVLGEVNGKMYAFVGLERVGGVVMYDITDPTNPTFASYVNTRDYSGDPEAGTSGNLAPEGLAFIPASESPNGTALLVVTYEVSGTVQVFELGEQEFSSVEELTSAMQARISPNPASGVFHVTLKDANVVSIDVMSLDGRIVRHTEANDSHVKVNVNGLNGVYLVNIQDQFGRSTVQKIVIQ